MMDKLKNSQSIKIVVIVLFGFFLLTFCSSFVYILISNQVLRTENRNLKSELEETEAILDANMERMNELEMLLLEREDDDVDDKETENKPGSQDENGEDSGVDNSGPPEWYREYDAEYETNEVANMVEVDISYPVEFSFSYPVGYGDLKVTANNFCTSDTDPSEANYVFSFTERPIGFGYKNCGFGGYGPIIFEDEYTVNYAQGVIDLSIYDYAGDESRLTVSGSSEDELIFIRFGGVEADQFDVDKFISMLETIDY